MDAFFMCDLLKLKKKQEANLNRSTNPGEIESILIVSQLHILWKDEFNALPKNFYL